MIGAELGRDGIAEAAGEAGRQGSGGLAARMSRFVKWLAERGEAGAARRLAGGAFAMRVVNAGLGFATQILLARWMGGIEYGIYAYLWVWLLFIGGVGSLGLPVAALKFVPDYTIRGDLAGLRGFLRQARTAGVAPSLAAALAAGIALVALTRLSGSSDLAPYLPAALFALATLPVYVLMDIQTGIARAYDFADLGLVADYLARPLLTLVLAAGLAAAGGPSTAGAVMAATFAAVALTALAQGIVLQRRLGGRIPQGPARAEFRRWREVSAPLLVVAGFTLLLGSTDILLLKAFVGPEEIALYFAATKIVAVGSFVAYGVAATSSHRFAAQAVSGDRDGTARLAVETVRWTFWPTLAVILGLTGLSKPLLSLFGPDYAAAWPVVAILSLGLLAQASVGPVDRALAMQDQGSVTARIYAASFVANVALGLVLIPILGLEGAALASAFTFAAKSALLYVSAKRRLGLDMFVLTAGRAVGNRPDLAACEIRAELVTPAEAARALPAWRELAARSLEPNVFYAPGFAPAGLAHLPEGRGAQVLMAWQDTGGTRRLVGLLPVVRARGRFLNPLPIRRAALLYGTLSTPLLDPDCPDAALAALIAGLRQNGIPGLLLPFLHEGGPAAAALDRVASEHSLKRIRLDGHARAMLRSSLSGFEYVRATLETRRRKEADRQRRRLAELGRLTFHVAGAGQEIGPALDAFLALESAGWKGRLGTDLAAAPGGLAFIREAAGAMTPGRELRVAMLMLDGRVVAAGLVVIAGRRAFYIKTAYDEDLARFSPGLLLTLDLTAHLLDDPEIDDADSIAVADHPMIDRIWTERFRVASVLVATAPGRGTAIRLAALAERLRDEIRVRSELLRRRFREWRASSANDTGKKSAAGIEH